MAFTGYFKTEHKAHGQNIYTLMDTSINQAIVTNRYNGNILLMMGEIESSVSVLGTMIYCQNEEDPSSAYKILNEVASNGPVEEYSSADTEVPIYACITDDLFFDVNDDFSEHEVKWSLTYCCKVVNIPPGRSPFIRFKFYKVDVGDAETLLFEFKAPVGLLYPASGITIGFAPTGSVLITDRLLIKVYHGSESPA